MKNENVQAKSFIKWVGGKGQLLKYIEGIYPNSLGIEITKYVEPFVGGGAVLFDILSKFELEEIYISDINIDLINTYRSIKDDVNSIIEKLKIIEYEYIPLNTDERKLYYYEKRKRFNEIQVHEYNNNIEKAVLFIFLNKTCFNGLYRVNKKGLYNVPIGSYVNPKICDEDNLKKVSAVLQKVSINYGDYKNCIDLVDSNTFVYFDPPYRPLTKTSNFTSYTENMFDDNSQIELSSFVGLLDKKGAKVVVSNSDPKNIDENDCFFDDLYKNYRINRVEAKRMINSNAKSRGKISELLIVNY